MWTSRRRGFTLLEVLAAVAVLALVYTALAQAAMQGLSHEGDASRRLEASLLADLSLAEIEGQLAAGIAPAVGLLEAEEGDFAVKIDVRPFDLGAFALQAGDAAAALLGEGTGLEGAQQGTPAFQLLTSQPGAPAPLLEIEVRIGWVEGGFEQEVTRTTFAADPATVAAALASLAPAEDAGTGDDEGGEEDADDQDGQPAPQPNDDDSGEEIPEMEQQ
jgi:prepilin-type N-terminal cleavage/methylation domain-containing protein